MRRALIALAMLALVFPAWQQTKGEAEVNFDFFYNNISGGSWIEVGDYGYCWQPEVAVSNTSWRPYADGYWAYTDVGWTWVSYEDFGWATYHYGRWARLDDYGWVWVPGRDADLEWGPAWVSWRTGGEYIGWAPLPPETMVVVEGRAITGHIDVEFNIGPACYNFVDVRYIGEPVLRERIILQTQNVIYVQQTVNVTNITYKNKTVYNYGPDIKVINSRANRPIQQLRIDRQQNVDFSAAAKSGAITKVQGDRLVVAGPMRVTRSSRTVAPLNVKAKVDKAKIDRGWSAVGDEKAQTEFKQKIKSQDLKNVPPPTGAGAARSTAEDKNWGDKQTREGKKSAESVHEVGPSPAASAAADASLQTGKEKGKNRPGDKREQNAGAASGASPATGVSPVAGSPPAGARDAAAEGGRGKGKLRNKLGDQFQNAPSAIPTASAAQSATGEQGQGKQKGHRMEQSPVNSPAGGASDGQGQGGGKHKGQGQGQGQGAYGQPGGSAAPAGQGQGQGSREGGKKNKGEASPVPSPQ